MSVTVECEHAVRCRIVNDRVGVLGGGDAAQHLKGGRVEHDDRAVVAGRREAVVRRLDERHAVGSVNVADLAEQLPVVLIHDHDAILPRNEHAVARRVRDDVVPAAFPAQDERVRDLVWPGCLSHEARHGAQGEDERETTHRSSSQDAPGPGGVRRRRTTTRITTRTPTKIRPNCQFIWSPLGGESHLFP